jgi:hypothetical protein
MYTSCAHINAVMCGRGISQRVYLQASSRICNTIYKCAKYKHALLNQPSLCSALQQIIAAPGVIVKDVIRSICLHAQYLSLDMP